MRITNIGLITPDNFNDTVTLITQRTLVALIILVAFLDTAKQNVTQQISQPLSDFAAHKAFLFLTPSTHMASCDLRGLHFTSRPHGTDSDLNILSCVRMSDYDFLCYLVTTGTVSFWCTFDVRMKFVLFICSGYRTRSIVALPSRHSLVLRRIFEMDCSNRFPGQLLRPNAQLPACRILSCNVDAPPSDDRGPQRRAVQLQHRH